MSGQVAQMFDQALDPLKGWFDLSALDKSAKLSAALLALTTAVPAGRCVHLDANGEFALGASDAEMPIFLWNGRNHPDVTNDGTSPITGNVNWIAISPTGVMSGLVATGGYELQTTEFDDDQAYLANEMLMADPTTGILTNQGIDLADDSVHGICSFHQQGDNQAVDPTSPVGPNAHGVTVLSFWPIFRIRDGLTQN
jgi:hypothetical protein